MRPLNAFALALAVACAQQQVRPPAAGQADGGTRPAAGAVDTGGSGDAGVSPPGTEPHKGALVAAGAADAGPSPRGGTGIAPPPRVMPGTLPAGLQLLELPATQNAIVNVQLRFRSGAIDDPRGKAGLTSLTARVMTEGGTQALSAKQLLEALFPLAAELDVRVDKG